MAYWLMKSEPSSFSIDDMAKKGAAGEAEGWDGVRNYQARNFMKTMQVGDKAFFYHSACAEPAIVGVIEIVKEAYPDPTQFDPESKYYDPKATTDKPRWQHVDVAFVEKWEKPITLKQVKANEKLATMKLVQKGSRLSVMPVTQREWQEILSM